MLSKISKSIQKVSSSNQVSLSPSFIFVGLGHYCCQVLQQQKPVW